MGGPDETGLWAARTFNQAIPLKRGFHVLTHSTHMNARMAYRKIKVLADVRIQANYIAIFYRLVFVYLIVKKCSV
jgi:hypothetical protein